STLYGRNTMGGVVNIYTLSPLSYQGVRLGMEYGSGNTWRLNASTYNKLRDDLGIAVALYYTQSDGFFDNLATSTSCDWEKMGGGRFKLQWRGRRGVSIENTTSFSVLTQGGYPYEAVTTGQINYNDPCTYDRTNISNGFTLRYDTPIGSLSSITSYQYSNDAMVLDQDFTPASYFTLRQAVREHIVTEDVVLRSHADHAYEWLFGAFGFYKHGRMNAPVVFLRDGIDALILKNANQHDPDYNYAWTDNSLPLESRFRMPNLGAALYHESNLRAGHWHFTLGVRVDYEYAQLRYDNFTRARYTKTHRTNGEVYPFDWRLDEGGRLRQSFTEVLPKVAVRYEFNPTNSLYASASKGYKAGGFNTQMFSDVLQQKMMNHMGFGATYDIDKVVTYKPEKSWNYEVGGHFTTAKGDLRGDFALFWIECRDQQITIFPEGTTTGRMMTNAGRTRSLGGEAAVEATLWRNFDLSASYGYTHAAFRRYHNGKQDFRGNRIPYSPEHTAALRATWTIPTKVSWLGNVVLSSGLRGVGRIWWNEENTLTQPFYLLLDASIRLEHARYSIDLWGRNLTGRNYDTFYFKSIGNEFLQRGRPRTFGITLHINL
ncbi:MAG: TonB-dependent receptor, partial [Alistipes sp.]